MYKDENTFFKWENGELFLKNKNGRSQELAYVHFQKRKVKVDKRLLNNNIESFYLVPNEITRTLDLNMYNNDDYKHELIIKKFRMKIGNIKNHSIQQSIFRKVRPIFRKFS